MIHALNNIATVIINRTEATLKATKYYRPLGTEKRLSTRKKTQRTILETKIMSNMGAQKVI